MIRILLSFLAVFVLTISTLSHTLFAQKTIDDPIVANTNSDYILLKTIELTPDSTVFKMEISCYEGLDYTLYDKGSIHAFKMIVGDKEYPLKAITMRKPGAIVCEMMSVQYFHLVFDALPQDTQLLTLQEGDRDETDLYFENTLLVDLETAASEAKSGNATYQKFLAQHYEHQYDYETAQEYLNMYIDQTVKKHGTQSEQYLDALSSQIQLNLNTGNYLEAEELSLQTIEAVGKDNPNVAGVMYTLGDVYQVLGKHKEAIDNYIQYLRTMEKGDKLRNATYSMINNLVMYSWASMTDTLDRKPTAVGVALDKNKKLKKGTVDMRIYAVGATEYMISEKNDFHGEKWIVYEPALKTQRKFKSKTKTVYLRFKDNKNTVSNTFSVDLK